MQTRVTGSLRCDAREETLHVASSCNGHVANPSEVRQPDPLHALWNVRQLCVRTLVCPQHQGAIIWRETARRQEGKRPHVFVPLGVCATWLSLQVLVTGTLKMRELGVG
jgi:hypothetical protein